MFLATGKLDVEFITPINLVFAGVVLMIALAVTTWLEVDRNTFNINVEDAKNYRIGKFQFKPKVILKCANLVILHLLVMICIFTVWGFVDAKYLTSVWKNFNLGENPGVITYLLVPIAFLVVFVLPLIATYMAGYIFMGLVKFTKKYSHIIFLVTFLCSTTFWCVYECKYNANVQIVTEVTENTEERELILFYEIPVQKVFEDDASGYHEPFKVSGEMFTTDTVPYVYQNAEGKGVWDFAPAECSEIVFIQEDDIPKVVIVTVNEAIIEVDNNLGESTVIAEKTTAKYSFYLPESALKYSEND